MEESILISTKKILGLEADYTPFDLDVITHINAAFSLLNQLGVGPLDGFFITDETDAWDDFVVPPNQQHLVKTYVYLKVRVLFDPPGTSFLLESANNQIKEYEWRLNVFREVELDPDLEEINRESRRTEFIEHHGVKGMKWGVRNPKNRVKVGKRNTRRTSFEKSPKRLTTHELEKRIKRMEMEKKYNQLNRRDVSKGSQITSEILTNVGKKVATTVVTGALLFGVKKVVAKKLGEEAASMFTKKQK